MKIFSLCLAAFALLIFCPGCASEESGYYTPSQRAAQQSGYDPTERLNNSRY